MGKRIELPHVYRAPVLEPRPAVETKRELPTVPTVAVKRVGGVRKRVPAVAGPVVEGEAGVIVIKRDRAKYNAYMRAYRARKKVEKSGG